jgi:uncharacterized membrane protein (DUF485 family)
MVLHGHGSAQGDEPEDEAATAHNTRLGRVLFVVYLAFYVGYVLLTAFKYDVMRTAPIGGINLAVLYGFGLIVGALVLALVYGVLARKPRAN